MVESREVHAVAWGLTGYVPIHAVFGVIPGKVILDWGAENMTSVRIVRASELRIPARSGKKGSGKSRLTHKV